MRRRFWIIAVSLFPLAFGAPASARTLDLLGLAAPQLDHRADRLELPHASPALKDGGLEDFRRAMRAFLTNDFQTAERLSRGLTQTAAEAPEGWYLLGMSLANLDRREDAIHALDQAAERYAENAAPLVVKGDLLLSLGRRDDAGAAWQEAIRVDPGIGAPRNGWLPFWKVVATGQARSDIMNRPLPTPRPGMFIPGCRRRACIF
ncbi:tetratricopeptide repeat protein [Paracoccus aerius]